MFESAGLKIERADHHIGELEAQLSAFVDSHPYTLAVGNDAQTGQTRVRINFRKPIPKSWAPIIGDAIHNLHTALDHMTWELIGHDGGTQDRYLKFPVGDSKASFDGSCDGIKTPSQSIKDLLKALEAFPGGKGNNFHALHHLDIADKHTVLMPIIRSATVSKYVIFKADGSIQSTWTENRFIVARDTGHIAIGSIPDGGYVELENDAKVTPDIVLGNVNAVGAMLPVIPILTTMSRETANAINFIERSVTE